MLTCREYIFRLTSGLLAEDGVKGRLQARLHLMICRRCRNFTANDAKLDKVLHAYREQRLETPDDAGSRE